jgi:hypothetical protein
MTMFEIVRKNIFRYVTPPLGVFAVMAIYAFSSGINNPVNFAGLLGIVTFIVTLAPALVIEMEEERNKGYAFLATLPVAIRDVVRVKFMMTFFSILALGAAGLALLASIGLPGYLLSESAKTLSLGIAFCLIFESIILVLALRFGSAPALVVLLFTTLMLNILTFVVASAGFAGGSIVTIAGKIFSAVPWPFAAILLAAGVAVFLMMIPVGARVKESRIV